WAASKAYPSRALRAAWSWYWAQRKTDPVPTAARASTRAAAVRQRCRGAGLTHLSPSSGEIARDAIASSLNSGGVLLPVASRAGLLSSEGTRGVRPSPGPRCPPPRPRGSDLLGRKSVRLIVALLAYAGLLAVLGHRFWWPRRASPPPPPGSEAAHADSPYR